MTPGATVVKRQHDWNDLALQAALAGHTQTEQVFLGTTAFSRF